MKRPAAFLALFALALVAALPAEAETKAVSAQGPPYAFDPVGTRLAMGGTVVWQNNSSGASHTSTQNGPLAKWDTGTIDPGEKASVVVKWAGTYAYHCEFHQDLGMVGTVRVPLGVSPKEGVVGTSFNVRAATADAPKGFVYDIQKKKGDGDWTTFKHGITKRSVTFEPTSAGTYSFRSRLRRTSGGKSGYSPARSITVTNPIYGAA